MNDDPMRSTLGSFHAIPHEMTVCKSFVVWKYESRDGKRTKVPYQAMTGQHASVTNPTHWCSFEDAIAVANKYDGIGFVFSESDPYAGIDLDDPEGDAVVLERQKELYKEFNSYSERSPSGNGLHIIIKGSVRSGRRHNKVEVYSSGRFFTMTGDVYNDKPIAERQDQLNKLWATLSDGKSPTSATLLNSRASNESDETIIDRARNAKNGAKFAALWDNNSLEAGDESAIDQALVNILQFHTKDPTQIDRLWLLSPQGQRSKTTIRKDYRERTIAKAFDREVSLIPIGEIKRPAILNQDSLRTVPSSEPPRPLRREVPPPQPFPIDALGDVLGSAVRAIVERIQCPDAIAAMSALGAASLAVQAHADVVIPATGHAKPLSLFLVTIAASGERKSAADFEALAAVRKFEKELRNRHDFEIPSYRNKLDAWEAQREKIKRKQGNDLRAKASEFDALGLPPVAPLQPMLTCTEPTFEGLCRLYIEGPAALGIFSDEGGQFVGGHGLNNDNRLRTITGLSSLWDGTPIKRVRAIDGVSVLPGRRLALHLMMQPDIASTFLSDPVLKDQGLLSRMLVAAPLGTAGTRFQRRTELVGSDALFRYNDRLLEILRRATPLAQAKINELEPRALPFDNSAATVWMDYADEVERRLAPNGAFEQIRGLANKLPEHAARIAGILGMIDEWAVPSIGIDALRRGMVIAEYFASEALRLFDAQMASPEIRLADILLKWLHTKWIEPVVGLKIIYQFGPNAIREAKTARNAVAVLEEHGWVERMPAGTQVCGSTVKEAWRIIRFAADTPATSANSLPQAVRE